MLPTSNKELAKALSLEVEFKAKGVRREGEAAVAERARWRKSQEKDR